MSEISLRARLVVIPVLHAAVRAAIALDREHQMILRQIFPALLKNAFILIPQTLHSFIESPCISARMPTLRRDDRVLGIDTGNLAHALCIIKL